MGGRDQSNVQGRWHDNRHTVITELSENGASREAIKSLVGHVSDAMVERYSHIGMEAKRAAVKDRGQPARGHEEVAQGNEAPAAEAGRDGWWRAVGRAGGPTSWGPPTSAPRWA